MATKHIVVGQRWRTRAGVEVSVSADRHEGHSGWPNVDTWRWALSSGEIVNPEGRAGLHGEDHHSDLIEYLGLKE